MDITFCGIRIRVYQDPKHLILYITTSDGTTWSVIIQNMGKNVL